MGSQICADCIMYIYSYYTGNNKNTNITTDYIKNLYNTALNNFCVCVIYLVFYVSSNIFIDDLPMLENQITFLDE